MRRFQTANILAGRGIAPIFVLVATKTVQSKLYMLRENVFTAVTLIMFAGFAYTVIRANYLIIVLRRQIVIPYHWSGRTSIAELKQAANLVKDDTQRKQIEKAISLLKASKAIAYGGFVVFVSLMVFWKR